LSARLHRSTEQKFTNRNKVRRAPISYNHD
jgi:hypothetical protein